MWILILRRIAAMGFSILFLTALIFFLMQAVFGDPVVIMLGRDADPDTVARLRQDLGLNRPAYVQYGDWLGRVAEGDWVRLVSRRGSLEARAAIGDRVYPGLVWMALHFAEAKVNWLTHDVGDPLIGTPEYKVSAVRLEPVNHGLSTGAD